MVCGLFVVVCSFSFIYYTLSNCKVSYLWQGGCRSYLPLCPESGTPNLYKTRLFFSFFFFSRTQLPVSWSIYRYLVGCVLKNTRFYSTKVEAFPPVLDILKQAITKLFQSGEWKQVVAGISTLSMIAEYVDDEATVLQMMQGIKVQLGASHAFGAQEATVSSNNISLLILVVNSIIAKNNRKTINKQQKIKLIGEKSDWNQL
ncbi:unnamed protein product [Polarella glacialis]|uniref:Uncharacterized protein n=1 Tax=Polarella glacialis TaxID=89957 RepID=A0A813GUQ8_POLGL|nr:unnamed protein product [Polarella glacialis]